MDLSHIFNSKKIFSISFCAVLFSLLSFSTFSQEHVTTNAADSSAVDIEHAVPKDEEDISNLILHHIAASHEWHFFGDVSVPLPVILWTNNGLVTFMSNKYGHNDHGTELIDANGTSLINYHGKYYYQVLPLLSQLPFQHS